MNTVFSSNGDAGDRPAADTLSGSGQSGGASSGKAHRSILLIDDRPEVARAMEIAFRMAGHDLTVATDPEAAHSRLARARFDAIVLDLNFTPGRSDGSEGLACLERIVAGDPLACVVVLTAHGGIRTAVAAMQAGARDFAVKPWKNADLISKVEAAIGREPISATAPTARQGDGGGAPPRLLGESHAIVGLRELVRRVGPTGAGVAITGPSGSGRTLCALAVHAASAEAGAEPLRLDLRDDDALDLIADARGTIILRHPDRLDEVAQDRLAARFPAAARPIAIAESVAALTPALHRRLATMELPMPPLAERREDIPLLARHFLADAAERFGRAAPRLTEAAEAALRDADWPDEVRGLALAMERAALLAEDGTVAAAAVSLPSRPSPTTNAPQTDRSFDLDRSERAMIAAALAEHHHNVSHAARALGLSRGALYRRMERHGL